MKIKALLALVTAGVVAFLASTMAQAEGAKLFDRSDLAQAKTEAKEAGKWVIVDFKASWCGPCKMMERTTWKDEKVIETVQSKAIPVLVDVDEQYELASRYGIEALPTIVVFDENGKELNRLIGYQSAETFVAKFKNI